MALGKINDTQWDDILAANARRISDPLWFIGYSPSRRLKRPIDIDWLGRAMESIVTQNGLVIDMVVLDYLQKLPYRGDKTEGISLNLDEYKRLLTQNGTFGCIGVQAKREVDNQDDKTPYLDDGQWTSNIEQSSDKVLSIVRPSAYCAQGAMFKSGNDDVLVRGYSQMMLMLLKQKLGMPNKRYWLDFDPRYNELNTAELKHINLND